MRGRPKKFDEEQVIRKASAVFWKKGYEASSAEELLKSMNMGKGSFYLHFKGGKKELYQRSLELFSADAMKQFNAAHAQAPDKIKFLKDFILSFAEAGYERKQKGCYLGNGIVEMSVLDNKTKDQAGVLMKKLEEAFEKIIAEAQVSGKLKTSLNHKLLAHYLINLRNGINITGRTMKDAGLFKKMILVSLEIIK